MMKNNKMMIINMNKIMMTRCQMAAVIKELSMTTKMIIIRAKRNRFIHRHLHELIMKTFNFNYTKQLNR